MSGLSEDLAAVGFGISSLSELRSSGVQYRAAVPVLVRWLELVDSTSEKEEIVRALSVPWARSEALDPLIRAFREVPDGGAEQDLLRWAIGNALEVLWDDSRFEELKSLALDERYGKAREMVVLGLRRSRRPEAGPVLVSLLKDPVVNGHAVKALRKLKVPAAKDELARLTSDDRSWVRKEAQRALAALD